MKIECTWPKPPVSVADNVLARLTSGEDNSSPIVWSELLGSFNSLPLKLSLTTPHSSLLLQHYLVELGPSMAPAPLKRNPFVSLVLPLAYSDELVMQCVVALGGAGLSFRQQSEDPVLKSSTTVHYYCVVKSLRLALQNLDTKDTGKILRILLVLILIANFEVWPIFNTVQFYPKVNDLEHHHADALWLSGFFGEMLPRRNIPAPTS